MVVARCVSAAFSSSNCFVIFSAAVSSSRALPASICRTIPRICSRISEYRRAFAACRFSEPSCFSTSMTMSFTRARFSFDDSSLASASRFLVLNFVTPAASSMMARRSIGFVERISPMRPCSMMAYESGPNPTPMNISWMSRSRATRSLMRYSLCPERYSLRLTMISPGFVVSVGFSSPFFFLLDNFLSLPPPSSVEASAACPSS